MTQARSSWFFSVATMSFPVFLNGIFFRTIIKLLSAVTTYFSFKRFWRVIQTSMDNARISCTSTFAYSIFFNDVLRCLYLLIIFQQLNQRLVPITTASIFISPLLSNYLEGSHFFRKKKNGN